MAIVNVVGSSIAREADNVFYTLAGPEIAVATTKAYSTQLIACYTLALQFAYVRQEIGGERVQPGMIAGDADASRTRFRKILEEKERRPVVRGQICRRKRYLLYRQRHRLRYQPGGQPED